MAIRRRCWARPFRYHLLARALYPCPICGAKPGQKCFSKHIALVHGYSHPSRLWRLLHQIGCGD